MINTGAVNTLLGRYGCEVSLSPDGTTVGRPYRAFVQPLRYKNKMYLEGTRTRVGYTDQSYYLYVGPGSVDVTDLPAGALLRMNGQAYYFSHAEAVRLSNETIYMWAILRLKVEEV